MLKTFRIFILIILLLTIIFNYSYSFSFEKAELKLGVYKYISEADIKKLLIPLTDYLSKTTNTKIKLYITSTYSELAQRFISGEFHLAIVPPYTYVLLSSKVKLKLLASMQVNGNYYYNGIIAVNKSSNINSLKDLIGKKFAFISKESASGYLYPSILFKNEGLDPEKIFSQIQFTNSHFESIKLLLNKSVDGIATFNEMLNYAQFNGLNIEEIKVIAQTENIPHEAFIAQYNLNEILAKQLQKALIEFRYKNEELVSNLSNKSTFKMEGWVIGFDSLYDSVRKAEKLLINNSNEKLTSEIILGIYPKDDIDIVLKNYQPLIKYLESNLKTKVKLVFATNELDCGNQLIANTFDIAILTPIALILTQNKSINKLVPLFQCSINGKNTYHSLIICRKDSNINKISDLKDKTFAFIEPNSISGRLYPLSIFKKEQIAIKTFFKKTYYAGNFENAINDVLNKKTDALACADYELYSKFSQNEIKQKFNIIYQSPPIPFDYLVTIENNNNLNDKTEKINNLILKLNKDPLKNQIFENLPYKYLILPSNEGLSNLKEILNLLISN